jgi:hypothetical protein
VAIGFIFLFFFKPDGTLDTLMQAIGLIHGLQLHYLPRCDFFHSEGCI